MHFVYNGNLCKRRVYLGVSVYLQTIATNVKTSGNNRMLPPKFEV
jgi:hypothetical protein